MGLPRARQRAHPGVCAYRHIHPGEPACEGESGWFLSRSVPLSVGSEPGLLCTLVSGNAVRDGETLFCASLISLFFFLHTSTVASAGTRRHRRSFRVSQEPSPVAKASDPPHNRSSAAGLATDAGGVWSRARLATAPAKIACLRIPAGRRRQSRQAYTRQYSSRSPEILSAPPRPRRRGCTPCRFADEKLAISSAAAPART